MIGEGSQLDSLAWWLTVFSISVESSENHVSSVDGEPMRILGRNANDEVGTLG
jgi:hypothetical protein